MSSLKWKPAAENSIDFRLNLHFPEYQPDSSDEDPEDEEDTGPRLDYSAMPAFELSVFEGGRKYKHFAYMHMTEKEWDDMKALSIPLDDRIVECAMDEQKRWKFLRFREDKKDGNHVSVVHSVLESIEDAVGEADLLAAAAAIKASWKARQAALQQQQKLAASKAPPPQGQQTLVRR